MMVLHLQPVPLSQTMSQEQLERNVFDVALLPTIPCIVSNSMSGDDLRRVPQNNKGLFETLTIHV
jgi:hypothetical protein